ncbi:type IV pilus modification PilV family protein [Thermocrinis sp.]
MCGTCRGFTLIEVLIALSILALGFSVLFELLASAQREYQLSKMLYEDITLLSNAILENKLDKVGVRERSLKDYPNIKEVELTYGNAVIYIYRR